MITDPFRKSRGEILLIFLWFFSSFPRENPYKDLEIKVFGRVKGERIELEISC